MLVRPAELPPYKYTIMRFIFLMCLTIKVFRLVVMYEPFWPRSLKQTPAFHHKNHRDTNLNGDPVRLIFGMVVITMSPAR